MHESSENTGAENVRQYFAKLALKGQSRARLAQWATLPVATFFVAMRLPASAVNVARRPFGQEPPSLGALFASVRWE